MLKLETEDRDVVIDDARARLVCGRAGDARSRRLLVQIYEDKRSE